MRAGTDSGRDRGNFYMKYAIDTLIAVLSADDKESIDRILYGDPYEVFKESESSEPMEEAEAREAFSKLHATARRKEDDGEPPSRISRDVCLLTQACMEGRRDVKFSHGSASCEKRPKGKVNSSARISGGREDPPELTETEIAGFRKTAGERSNLRQKLPGLTGSCWTSRVGLLRCCSQVGKMQVRKSYGFTER